MSCPWHADSDSDFDPTDYGPTDYGEEDEEAKEETKKRAIEENKKEVKEEAQKTKKARDSADAAGLWRQPPCHEEASSSGAGQPAASGAGQPSEHHGEDYKEGCHQDRHGRPQSRKG